MKSKHVFIGGVLAVICVLAGVISAMWMHEQFEHSGLEHVHSVQELYSSGIEVSFLLSERYSTSFQNEDTATICKAAQTVLVVEPTGTIQVDGDGIRQECWVRQVVKGIGTLPEVGDKVLIQREGLLTMESGKVHYNSQTNLMNTGKDYLVLLDGGAANEYRAVPIYTVNGASLHGIICLDRTSVRKVSNSNCLSDWEGTLLLTSSEAIARMNSDTEETILNTLRVSFTPCVW